MSKNLHGKVALVTGASKGIGAATAARFAAEGVIAAGLHEGDMRQWIETVTPLARIGKAEEIAAAFLASDQASYITGETVHVTGGLR